MTDQLKTFVEKEDTRLGLERNDQRNIVIPLSLHFAKYETEEQTENTREWIQSSEWDDVRTETRRIKEEQEMQPQQKEEEERLSRQ